MNVFIIYKDNNFDDFERLDQVELGCEIGKGIDAVVFEGYCSSDKVYAIKKPNAADRSMFIMNELRILEVLNKSDPTEEKSTIRLKGTCIVDGLRSIILDRAQCSLRQFLKNKDFEFEETRLAALKLTEALEFIHDNGVVHGDLRAENILVSNDESLKICDFGGAFQIGEEKRCTVREHRHYISPERILNEELCDTPSDIWSLASVIYEIALKRLLFPLLKGKNSSNERNENLCPYVVMHELTLGEEYPMTIRNQSSEEGDKIYRMSRILIRDTKFVSKLQPFDSIALGIFSSRYPGRESELSHFISMLKKMLALDPVVRITAKDLLQEPFLKAPERL